MILTGDPQQRSNAMNYFKEIFTIDNALHVLLWLAVFGLIILPAIIFWLAWWTVVVGAGLGATAALYLREQGQARSWLLKKSFHKHMEWIVPGVVGMVSSLVVLVGIKRKKEKR